MSDICTVRGCGQEVPDRLLHCTDCREGRYPELRSGEFKGHKNTIVMPKKSEAEIRRELAAWCYAKGAVKVIDTEQGYRLDKCPHCHEQLGKGHATTRIVRGFPDLIVLWPAPRRTWWVEAKSATGKQSEHQLQMQQWLTAAGEIYIVARSTQDLDELEREVAA